MATRRRYYTRAAAAAEASTATESDSSGLHTPERDPEVLEAEQRRDLYRRCSIMGADAERPWVKEYECYRSKPPYQLASSYGRSEDEQMESEDSDNSEEVDLGDANTDHESEETMVADQSSQDEEMEDLGGESAPHADGDDQEMDFETEDELGQAYDSDDMKDACSESEHDSDDMEDRDSGRPPLRSTSESRAYTFVVRLFLIFAG
ncbi:hypothetical protein OE88DRAFT_1651606 [Heliocybe sulcata]|uniref:Uncharacterized protein n=1 Tax=Heliocybe sulcata TaxID=5364 RepID=A0A5C3NLF9_9AGAM|nr:hypothetical protein OE88DRAFT_1651606 [Heliocybe sulcata]